MDTAPFPVDPELLAIAIAYRNAGYIADEVLFRVMVGKAEFKYWEYPIAETFMLPDTKVGRRSEPNVIDLTATELTDKVEDYGLDDIIPNEDIDNAPANHSPVDNATVQLTDYVMLDREKRVADLVFNTASYAAANQITLAGVNQFSDFANSDPLGVINDALDACLMRPNIAVVGQEVWTKLKQHPDIIKSINGTSGDKGNATKRQVADLFELEEILVGQSRLNTAKKGQAPALSRVWGKHISLQYRNRNARTTSGLTFGYTAQQGGKVAGQMAEPKIGLTGSVRVRSGEKVKEKIVASQAGYWIENAVA